MENNTYINNLSIMASQQLTEWRNCASLNKLRHLLLVAANRQITDGPRSLFLSLKFTFGQVFDDLRQETSIDDSLHLRLDSSGNIRQEPHGFLSDLLLGMTQESREVRKCVVVENDLSLLIWPGDDVADGAQRGRLNLHLNMWQQWDQVWHNTAIDDQLDLLVPTVCQVTERPDGIDQDVDVRIVNEMTERWKDLIDGLNRRRWILVATQIDNHPGDVTEEADRDIRFHEGEQRLNDAHLYDIISKLRSISNDVSERPDSLLTNVCCWRKQESDEEWNGPCVDDLKTKILLDISL